MPGEVTYSRLLSAGPEATAPELLAEVRPRERAPADRPFVFVNMVSTIDGRAQVSGRTRDLGDEADLEMLLELRSIADVPAVTPESTAMAKELKRRGFRFVGPTTAYALMQATGMVNDHLVGCHVEPAG